MQLIRRGKAQNYLWPCKVFHMSVILILIIVSVLVAGSFLAAFLWSVKKGQFDDDYTPSVRMLFDDTVSNETKHPN